MPASKSKRRTAPKEFLSETVYNHLVHKLLTRELVPGDLINRRQIAAELHISVAPVLEAMVHLQNDGFLESIPRKGTLVKSIKQEDLRGQVILREALECEAARFYCGKKIAANLPKLRKLAQAAEESYGEPAVGWRTEFEFHRALVELAGCPALLEIYDKVMRYKVFMAQNLLLIAHEESGHSDHYRLLKELETEDPARAEQAIRRHIRAGKTKVLGLPES